MKTLTLIHRYLSGEASEAEVAELDKLLADDPALRKQLITEAGIDAALRELALERISESGQPPANVISPIFRPLAWTAIAAAIALMASFAWTHFSQPKVIATLVSGEDASWESSLPTTPGSNLTAGHLKLTSGIATILFRSGAELQLEAPARIHLQTPMRSKLIAGSPTMNVPESAIGFVMETPDGYVVDHGTQFSVNVAETPGQSSFEVLEGEISVHLPATGEQVRLKTEESARISDQKLTTYQDGFPDPEPPTPPPSIRIKTEGRATSIVRNNFRYAFLNPEMLMVRTTPGPRPQERRSLIELDVSKVNFNTVESANLWLNLVPSGQGFATRLPQKNTFGFYGITDQSKENWPIKCQWEDAPSTEDGVLLGTIDIPRSRQTGRCGIQGKALLDFLKEDPDGKVSILIVRETAENPGKAAGLVHAFASDSHPEASGPVLKLTLKE